MNQEVLAVMVNPEAQEVLAILGSAWCRICRFFSSRHESFLLPPAAEASLLDGGPRSDVKRFRPAEGFTLPNWPTFAPRRSPL